jgi:hypothetical protein
VFEPIGSSTFKLKIMKHANMMLFFGALVAGFALPSFAQEVLPEVTVTAVKYKYLSAVNNKELAQPVKLLERKAAEFDIKNSEYYDDEYDEYSITFYIPDGYILATYNNDGKLLRTAERFKNIALPLTVSKAVAKRFPQWSIPKDVYLVTYEDEKGATKVWRLLLKNGDKRLRVKANEKGEFME